MYGAGELTAGQLKNATAQLAGMTLRDYFAAKAMEGLVVVTPDLIHFESVADAAYKMADAMLKAREQ
jgi:hypothetical protein